MKTMMNIWSGFWNQCKKLNKIRILIGLSVSILLFSVSFHYLYDGFGKRFLIFTFLSLAAGFFIAVPMPFAKYVSIPVSLLYLLYVPKKMFERIELPVHDMSGLMDGAYLANEIIILMVFMILFFLFQKMHLALGTGSVLILIISLVNFYVYSFRGNGLNYSDIFAVRTAMTVAGNYRLFMNAELWYSILFFCFFISWGFWCKIPYKGAVYHAAVTGIAGAFIFAGWFFFQKSDYIESHGFVVDHWNMGSTENLNGLPLGFFITAREYRVAVPEGYSENKIQEIIKETENNFTEPQSDGKKPHIIMIMNEAWSDLKILGDLRTTDEYMPFTDSLTENVIRGNLHVGVLGGLTANTEFEALMGDSLAFLSPSSVPYQFYFTRNLPSMASVLKEQGYQTMAMHPSVGFAWNRDQVYPAMGFEKFIDIDQFHVEYEHLRTFISDKCNFDEIIYQFEHREPDKPMFLFDVTIQNHGSYYGEIDVPIEVEGIGNAARPSVFVVQTYLNLIRITEDAFQYLLDYFTNVEEPVIICMFGDHQPLLSDAIYGLFFENQDISQEEMLKRKYITPYVIWSNFDNDFSDYGDISANYLGAILMECAGAELPPYYQYLLELRKEYPVISHMGCMDKNGNIMTINDIREEDWIKNYETLQYGHLFDAGEGELLFSLEK